ncbi:MAG TPA: hypothetical protein VN643_19940 [Pyrinomonadaceae bacterium]|nr:hypothetical protein [Pyrinomonadaceae bacterium]
MRPVLFALSVISLLFINACSGFLGKFAHKQVGVPQLLTPLVSAETSQLVAEVNRLAAIKSLHGKLDIQVQDTSFAAAGKAEKYRAADADVTVQRPGKVYLVIQFAHVDIAHMSSDGEQFRVALLKGDEKYKKFVKGTNRATYGELKPENVVDKQNKNQTSDNVTVGSLSNLRPQHLTEALLVRPIEAVAQSGLIYSQSEFYEEEADTRPQAKSGARVVRGYYVLEEMATGNPGEAHLKRRLWFDRVGAIRLARVQTFDERGLLDTDINYAGDVTLGEGPGARQASRIELTRPKDHYKLSLIYQAPESVVIDKDWPAEVFVLQNRWQLPEVDLDAPKQAPAKASP